jgi:class 3 adenylate cyclase
MDAWALPEHNHSMASLERPRFRAAAWPIGIFGLLVCATTGMLVVANHSAIHSVDSADPIELVLPVGYAVIGALLASRRPRNPIGWIFLGISVFTALPGVATQYVLRSTHIQRLPLAPWVAWTHDWMVLLVFPTGLAVFFFLLFPDGRLQSARWRWVAGGAIALMLAGVGLVMVEQSIELTGSPSVRNPIGIHGVDLAHGFLSFVFWLPGLAIVIAAMAGTIWRGRRSTGELRQQLRWLGYASAATAAGLISVVAFGSFVPGISNVAWDVVIVLGFGVAIPISCAVAILKHGLYDLDVVISKTVVYGLLAAFSTVVYVAVVVGIGTAVGSSQNPVLTVLAAALIALAFNPARQRAKHLANRVVYGRRATPYEILSEFMTGMAGSSAAEDALPRMARLVGEATGAVRVTVWIRLGDILQPEASWPETEEVPAPIPLEGRSVEQAVPSETDRVFPVEHEGDLLGVLAVTAAASEPLTPSAEKLIGDLAAQTGLGLSFERMKERALFARALASFLPPEVAELVEASPSALALQEEVEATILFSDIRGFSALAERLSPREVHELLTRHIGAMAEVVSAHGGTLDKFAGDAVMAVFGVPRKSDDHAERAIACAVAMQGRQAALNQETVGHPEFQIGIGLNTGIVIAGTIGGHGRLDYTVLGDAVNVAQRLQGEAIAGEILASEKTVARAGIRGAESAGLRRLKGREAPVEAFRVQ